MAGTTRTLTKDITTYGSAGTTVRTASASGEVVMGLRITNTTASTIKVCVYITPDTDTTKYYLIGGATASTMGASVLPGQSLVVVNGDIDKVNLNNGDVIKAFTDTATCADAICSVYTN